MGLNCDNSQKCDCDENTNILINPNGNIFSTDQNVSVGSKEK